MSTDRAVEFIESVGGDAVLEDGRLCGVDLSGTGVVDGDMALFADQIAIDHIRLDNTAITDEGIRELRGLVNLESLSLGGTAVTGDCLFVLPPHALKRLSLSGCEHFRNINLCALPSFVELERLWLDGTAVDDEALRHLQGMDALRFLGLGSTRVTDEGILHLANLRSLRSIDTLGTRITYDGQLLLHDRNKLFRPTVYLL